MNPVVIIKTLLSLVPVIIQAVQAVEDAIGPGKGSEKLEAVKGTIQSAYAVAQAVEAPFETLWPAVSGTVGAVVSLFNATGVFKRSVNLAPASPPPIPHENAHQDDAPAVGSFNIMGGNG